MEHVYQDQPAPTDTTGVPIVFYVVDANGNYRTIGTTTSTPGGSFGFTWTPDISGDYVLYATFAGSNSYWPTTAETSFYAADTPTVAPTPVAAQPVDSTMTIIGVGVAIIIVIAIIGAILLMAIRKRP
jgi:hypothetical protein